jgi:hypothetical protein
MVGEVISTLFSGQKNLYLVDYDRQWEVTALREGYELACQEEGHKESLKGLWTHQHCLHPPQIEEWE